MPTMQTKHKIYTGLLSLNRAVVSWQEITHAEHPAYMYTVFTNHILSNGQGTTITLRIICVIFSVKIHASSVKLSFKSLSSLVHMISPKSSRGVLTTSCGHMGSDVVHLVGVEDSFLYFVGCVSLLWTSEVPWSGDSHIVQEH